MREAQAGVAYAVAAYLVWGFSPLYWKLLVHLPAMEQLAHRILWCALLLGAYLVVRGRLRELRAALGSRRVMASLAASTVFIAANWFIYIWAVGHDQILQASLGYFINPLVSVLLGMLFLGERLSRLQGVSVAVAAVGVVILALGAQGVPWISLVLAGSFGFYGLLRKTVPAGPEVGLLVEVVLLSPFMLAYLWRTGEAGAFGHHGWGTDLLLVAAGVITMLPLLWFTHGARRLPLATIGLLQYLAPSAQFLLAVGLYGEPFAARQLTAFLCIWTALALFTVDLRRRSRRSRPTAAPLTAPASRPPAPR